MTIIPAINMIVDQLIPLDDSTDSSVTYQKSTVKILCRFKVSMTASTLRIPKPNTKSSVKIPQPIVMFCLSKCSITIIINITTKITNAKICAIVIAINPPILNTVSSFSIM